MGTGRLLDAALASLLRYAPAERPDCIDFVRACACPCVRARARVCVQRACVRAYACNALVLMPVRVCGVCARSVLWRSEGVSE